MLKYDFDHNKAAWDGYRRPHIGLYKYGTGGRSNPFIVFDTGEVIARQSRWDPGSRCHYNALGVTVRSTADDSCPALHYSDGTPVAKAHLTDGGGQYVMIDDATGVVVGCGQTLQRNELKGTYHPAIRDLHLQIPTYFMSCYTSVYWSGPGREPVGSRIKVVRPVPRSKEEMDHVKRMSAAAIAWAAMQSDAARNSVEAREAYRPPSERHYKHSQLLRLEKFIDMPEHMRWNLSRGWKVQTDYEAVYVDKLYVKNESS